MRSSSLPIPEMITTTGKRTRSTTDIKLTEDQTQTQNVSLLLDAAAEIQTPPKSKVLAKNRVTFDVDNNVREINQTPITYNGIPFSGVTRTRTNFFAQGVQMREAREAEAAENRRLAAIYGIPVETYIRDSKALEEMIIRLGRRK